MRKFLKKLEVTNITNLTKYQIDKLEVGDVVAKKTNGQYHHYIVSYKENNVGICLTYTDASVVETVSYDYVEGNWVYNSTDTSSIEGGGGTTVIANPTLAGTEADLTGLQVGDTKYAVPQGGGDNGHTLTVQFSTVYDRGSDIPPSEYQVFKVGLLKYLNGNVVTSIETINDNNEHTFENVIAYNYTYAGDTDLGEPSAEVVSETGITSELNDITDNDNENFFDWMIQLFTNSNVVVKYIITLPA